MSVTKMPLIAFCGYKGSGKSTAAMAFSRAERVSFADPIKDMLEALGVKRENLYGPQSSKEQPLDILGGKSARQAMQTLGTEWGRELVHGNVWVDAVSRKLSRLLRERAVVIDDVRFENERGVVKEYGGILIRIEREGCKPDGHASEKFIASLPVDAIVVNNGTPEELMSEVYRAYMERSIP